MAPEDPAALAGAITSLAAAGVRLPLAVVVRRGPGGMLYALQRWQVQAGGPLELHLARWLGAPTAITLASDGQRLTGSATFQGKPVTGFTSTLEGKRLRIYVYVDCLGCPGKSGWSRLIGVAPKADGTFGVFLKPSWLGRRYRATVAGQNVGTTFAPDAQAEAASRRREGGLGLGLSFVRRLAQDAGYPLAVSSRLGISRNG